MRDTAAGCFLSFFNINYHISCTDFRYRVYHFENVFEITSAKVVMALAVSW